MTSIRKSIVLMSGILVLAANAYGQYDSEDVSSSAEVQSDWEFFAPVERPADSDSPWSDMLLTNEVFDKARSDLSDLRLYDQGGKVVPYALRVLQPRNERQLISGDIFNRAEVDGVSEATIDLKRADVEHNRIEIDVPGSNFRRAVELEGSDDQQQWRKIVNTRLVRFSRGSETLDGRSISYQPSRYRYLRVRVSQDPVVDREPVRIADVKVFHTIVIPGELMVRDAARVGEREPTRSSRANASSWTIDLGGANVPCSSISVDVGDDAFVRDYVVEALYTDGNREHFYRVSSSQDAVWRRLAGAEKKPLEATFNEVRTSQLRLIIIDNRNPSLNIQAVRFSAAARQIVVQSSSIKQGSLRLFFGNPTAEFPVYDFARNLPKDLAPVPVRTKLLERAVNPSYVAPPLPFTERWPWLIYVVLGSVSLVLALLIFNLSRAVAVQQDISVETAS